MIAPPDSEKLLVQTLNTLEEIQKQLRKLLRDCSVSEAILPRHSLFSSKRSFRADELNTGLHFFGNSSGFTLN